MPAGKDIDAYGDSIMVGSLAALRYYFPGIRIDARVQPAVVRRRRPR